MRTPTPLHTCSAWSERWYANCTTKLGDKRRYLEIGSPIQRQLVPLAYEIKDFPIPAHHHEIAHHHVQRPAEMRLAAWRSDSQHFHPTKYWVAFVKSFEQTTPTIIKTRPLRNLHGVDCQSAAFNNLHVFRSIKVVHSGSPSKAVTPGAAQTHLSASPCECLARVPPLIIPKCGIATVKARPFSITGRRRPLLQTTASDVSTLVLPQEPHICFTTVSSGLPSPLTTHRLRERRRGGITAASLSLPDSGCGAASRASCTSTSCSDEHINCTAWVTSLITPDESFEPSCNSNPRLTLKRQPMVPTGTSLAEPLVHQFFNKRSRTHCHQHRPKVFKISAQSVPGEAQPQQSALVFDNV